MTDNDKMSAEDVLQRRLSVFRRSGFFGDDTRGAVVSRATSVGELRQAFLFIHDIYVQCGFIRPTDCGLRIRPWDLAPTTAVFVAKHDNEVVGSLIVVGDSPALGVPVDAAFGDITTGLRAPGRSLVELGVQIVAPAFRRGSLLTELQRCAFAHLSHKGYTDFVTIVSPAQRHFMEIMDLHALTGPRRWNPALKDLVVLVAGDRSAFEARRATQRPLAGSVDEFRQSFLVTDNPYRAQVPAWDAAAASMFDDPTALRSLAAECPELWQSATQTEQEALALHLGGDLGSFGWMRRSA